MSEHVLPDYDIHKGTIAVLSAAAIEYSSIVLEPDQTLYIRKPPLQLIKEACLEGGSTYDGRREAVTHLTGAQNKVPIPVNPREYLFAFPTHSPQLFECNWLFYHHIHKIQPKPKTPGTSIVTFKTRQDPLTLDVSHHSLQKQIQRTAYCIVRFSMTHLQRLPWDEPLPI
jgi:competence protein ComK